MIGRGKPGKIAEPSEKDFFRGKREGRLYRQMYTFMQQDFRNNLPPHPLGTTRRHAGMALLNN